MSHDHTRIQTATSSLLALALVAGGCGMESAPPVESASVPLTTIELEDHEGARRRLDVLRIEQDGPVREIRLAVDGDRYAVLFDAEDAFTIVEVLDGAGETLALAEIVADGTVTVSAGDGFMAHASGGAYPLDDEIREHFDPVALLLLSDPALSALATVGEPTADGHLATDSAALSLSVFRLSATCGVTCSSFDKSATCCCDVGERCRRLSDTCICEDAHEAFRFRY